MRKLVCAIAVLCFFASSGWAQEKVVSQAVFVERNRDVLSKLFQRYDPKRIPYRLFYHFFKNRAEADFLSMLSKAVTYEGKRKIENPFKVHTCTSYSGEEYTQYLIYIDFQENQADGYITDTELIPVGFAKGELFDVGFNGNIRPIPYSYKPGESKWKEVDSFHYEVLGGISY